MSLLHFTTSDNGMVSIETKYIVLVYPSHQSTDEKPLTQISDISGSRSLVTGTYEAILGYIRDSG